MEPKITKLILLVNNQILVSQIEEVGADIGEPDCKLTNPYNLSVTESSVTLTPWLAGLTSENYFMISSEKILTLTDPTKDLIKKYEELTKE